MSPLTKMFTSRKSTSSSLTTDIKAPFTMDAKSTKTSPPSHDTPSSSPTATSDIPPAYLPTRPIRRVVLAPEDPMIVHARLLAGHHMGGMRRLEATKKGKKDVKV